tara:strand:+ start:736 stop:1137 length:402 start_codon:yes stop_codon:yes gene_type:complete
MVMLKSIAFATLLIAFDFTVGAHARDVPLPELAASVDAESNGMSFVVNDEKRTEPINKKKSSDNGGLYIVWALVFVAVVAIARSRKSKRSGNATGGAGIGVGYSYGGHSDGKSGGDSDGGGDSGGGGDGGGGD